MDGVKVTRGLLGTLGVVVGVYGAHLLISREDTPEIRNAVEWLIAAIVLHDGLVAAFALVVGFVSGRTLPAWLRRPVTVGMVVLGTVTVVAIPMLGRFGARPDNPTLLDRHYTIGWLVLAALVVVGVAAGAVWSHRRDDRSKENLPDESLTDG